MSDFDAAWPDIWSEYQDTFSNLEMNEGEAKAIIVDALDCARVLKVETSADEIADALKEFCVLLWDRQRTALNIPYRGHLAWAIRGVHGAGSPDKVAEHYFGTRGAKLYAVLATMYIDVPDAPVETRDSETREWLAGKLERVAELVRQRPPADVKVSESRYIHDVAPVSSMHAEYLDSGLERISVTIRFPPGVDLVSDPPAESKTVGSLYSARTLYNKWCSARGSNWLPWDDVSVDLRAQWQAVADHLVSNPPSE